MSSLDGTTRPVQARLPATRQGTAAAGSTGEVSSRQVLQAGGKNLPVAANTGPNGQAEQAPNAADVREAARTIASFVQNISRELRFSVDESSGHTVVTVMDENTEQVIRQIPSEELLALARFLQEKTNTEARGLLINREA